jgi:hypothetical protein
MILTGFGNRHRAVRTSGGGGGLWAARPRRRYTTRMLALNIGEVYILLVKAMALTICVEGSYTENHVKEAPREWLQRPIGRNVACLSGLFKVTFS